MKKHSDDNRFKCEQCFKVFNRADSYKNHVSTHSSKKRFKCDVCSSEFNYKSSYNRHCATHNTESLYICDICGKAFRRADYVDSHKKLTHGQDIKQPKIQYPSHAKCISLSKEKTKLRSRKKMSKAKKSVKKISTQYGARTPYSDVDLTTINTETGTSMNAVPILMSMAENAANSVLKKPSKKSAVKNSSNTTMMADVGTLLSSPQIDNGFISCLDDSSNDERSECESNNSDGMRICISETEDDLSMPAKRASCIVSNQTTEKCYAFFSCFDLYFGCLYRHVFTSLKRGIMTQFTCWFFTSLRVFMIMTIQKSSFPS